MKKAVICFTRVPRPGQTKTRLMPVLSGEQCAQLHRAFLQDLNAVYQDLEADLLVAYTPDPHWQALQSLLPCGKQFFQQEGDGLGARMHNALCQAFRWGYESVLLTGSDLPELKKEHLEHAFAVLAQADVVLGPTRDGGYYLVGMKRPCARVFEGHKYGGSTVLESTLAAIADAGLKGALESDCEDVDTPEDLARLSQTLPVDSTTGQFLKKAGCWK